MDTLEVAYTRRKAEQIVTALERPLNRHVIKLLGLAAAQETRAVWKKEAKRWLREIAAIRLKPEASKLKAADLFAWLYDEPFGEVELTNIAFILDDEGEGFMALAAPEAIAPRLKTLHEALAPRLAAGDPGADLVDAL